MKGGKLEQMDCFCSLPLSQIQCIFNCCFWAQPFGFNDPQFWNLGQLGHLSRDPDDFIRVFPEDGYGE